MLKLYVIVDSIHNIELEIVVQPKLSARTPLFLSVFQADFRVCKQFRSTFFILFGGTVGKGFDGRIRIIGFKIIMWLQSIIENRISSHLNHFKLAHIGESSTFAIQPVPLGKRKREKRIISILAKRESFKTLIILRTRGGKKVFLRQNLSESCLEFKCRSGIARRMRQTRRTLLSIQLNHIIFIPQKRTSFSATRHFLKKAQSLTFESRNKWKSCFCFRHEVEILPSRWRIKIVTN